MSAVAANVPMFLASEIVNGHVSLAAKLRASETLTGTPTVAEIGTSDLTLGSKAVSTAELTILGATVAAAEAVTFTMSGQQAGKEYSLRVTCGTTASQTLGGIVQFLCKGDGT